MRPQHEVLSRLAGAFRRVVIDWAEGDRWVEARISALTDLDAHGVVLEAERALRGRTALVSLADAAGEGSAWVRFYMTPDTESLDLHYEPPGALEACRVLARKLAEVLGYEFTTEEDQPEVEEDPPSDMLMHRDLWPDAEGRLPPAKSCLPAEELVRRIANRFPLAVIDRDRPANFGHRLTYVTIRDAVGGPQFRCRFFSSEPPTIISIEYERPQDREACRPLLEALLAELADYYHVTQDDDDESENVDE
jgi:hypothetical protein